MGRLSFSDARHLVARTALGSEYGGIKEFEGKTKSEAIKTLLTSGAMKYRLCQT